MIGKRLFKLLHELNASQSKRLLHYNKVSADKRLSILSKLIKNRNNSHDDLLILLTRETKTIYPHQNKTEFEHTLRRMSDFFCTEIENTIIIEATEKDVTIRSRILSDHFTQSANPYLSDYYLSKGYINSLKEDDDISSLYFGSKLITLNYSKYTKSDFIKGLNINESNKELIENLYINKLVEYYSHISNVYIENYTLIKQKPEDLEQEIETVISKSINPLQTIDLRISQMRLSYNQPDYERYVAKVESLIDKISDNKLSYLNLRKKYFYMKLIYGFFTGKNINDLLYMVNEILSVNEKTKHVDSIAMWYKVILHTMNNELDVAKELLSKSKYFKLDYSYLKEFSNALIYLLEGNFKKCIPLFNNLIDSKNYFIGQLSLITLLKVHLHKGNEDVCHSLIQSGSRQIKLHSEKFVINNSTLITLNYFKEIINQNKPKQFKSDKSFCCFHQFILNLDLNN